MIPAVTRFKRVIPILRHTYALIAFRLCVLTHFHLAKRIIGLDTVRIVTATSQLKLNSLLIGTGLLTFQELTYSMQSTPLSQNDLHSDI